MHIETHDCPLGKFPAKGDDALIVVDPPPLYPSWNALHVAALAGQLTPAWLNTWAIIGCGDCRTHYEEWTKVNPCDGSFAWTVDLHNAVNLRLGKPAVTVEAARGMYERQG